MERDSGDSVPDSPRESDAEKSFVKKVRSRVSSILPSSLSKWFGNGEKSNIRTRDDLEEDSFYIEPPSKRVKRPNVNYSESSFSENLQHPVANSTLFVEPIAGPSGVRFKKSSPNVSQNHIFPNLDKESEDEESTSGYSSMVRIGSKERNPEPIKLTYNPSKRLNLKSSTNNFEGTPERSLFLESSLNHSANATLSSRRPAFNSSITSPSFVDKTLSTKRIVNSPFYKGRTIYGGAAAYSSHFLSTKEENKALMKAPVTMKPINEPVSSSAMLSKTAKRILDTLDQFTTPLADAKKIPNPSLKHKEGGLISRYRGANPYLIREPKALNKELQVPTVPDLLKMKLKEKLQDSTVNSRKIANASKVKTRSPNQEAYTVAAPQDTNHTNKIRSKITATRQRKADSNEETAEAVNLPEAKLPITELPKFDLPFGLPFSAPTPITKPVQASTKATITAVEKPNKPAIEKSINIQSNILVSSTPIPTLKTTQQPTKALQTTSLPNTNIKPIQDSTKVAIIAAKTNKDAYTFAKPIVVSENTRFIKAINNYVFREPINKLEKTTGVNFKASCETPGLKRRVNGEHSELITTGSVMDVLSKKSPEKWQCTSCLVRNNDTSSLCVKCLTLRPKKNTSIENSSASSTCSVPASNTATKLANNDKSSFGDKFKAPADTWECSTCMIRNKSVVLKCVACETAKPAQKSALPTVQKPTLPIVSKNADTWECPTCMIRNKNDLLKCQACECAKPVPKTTSGSFGDKFKAPSGTWECSVCMIRNAESLSKCQACETQRQNAPKPATSKLTFAVPSGTWECSVCMIRNKNELLKCQACEASKPGAPTGSLGDKFKMPNTWECPTCMIKNEDKAVKCVACECAKPGAPTTKSGFGTQFNKSAAQWECPSCMVRNGQEKSECVCCGSVKPGAKPQVSAPAHTPINSFTFGMGGVTTTQGFTFGIQSASKPTETKTNAAEVFGQAKKTDVTATSGSFTFGVQTTKPAETNGPKTPVNGVESTFKFGTTPNKDSTTEPSKEKAPEFTFKATSAEKTSSAIFDVPKTTTTILFGATTTPTFGIATPTKNKTATTASPAFTINAVDSNKTVTSTPTFGQNAASTTASSTPTFGLNKTEGFGLKKPEISTPTTTFPIPKLEGFTAPTSAAPTNLFGGPSATPNSQMLFGNKPDAITAQKKENFTFNAPKSDLFSAKAAFGAPVDQSKENKVSSWPQDPKPTFGSFGTPQEPKSAFGATKPTFGAPTAAATPAFGSGASAEAQPAEKVFKFGGAAPTSENKGAFTFGQASKAPTPAFGFGSGAPAEPSKPFVFGAPKPVETATPVFGRAPAAMNGEWFGSGASSNTAKTGFSFGAPAAPPAAAFNFGAAANPNPTPNQGFNFGAASTPTPTFNFTGNGNPVAFTATGGPEKPQRIIKRAMRRTQR